MFATIEIPVWLFALILLFAVVTAASHLFIPPVRWFLRRRMERAVSQINTHLDRPIQPFKLARRHDTILRLTYDPAVAEAVSAYARETGLREDVVFSLARRYAREIVPSFSAYAYFGVAIRAARWLSIRLFHVRMVRVNEKAIADIDPEATVVFVMNHRSNMDYVLVTYLAAQRSALSYAVGEWARIWPVSWLLRGMGAYFIRRRSRNSLYRRVLARYVQMAIDGGVTQAIFPEGGLSLDGRVAPARLGLLSYISAGHDAAGRDVVFVPVSLNYDKVLEDTILIDAGRSGERRFRGSFLTGTAFALRWLWRRIRAQARRFGYAAVVFGEPMSLSGFKAEHGDDVGGLGETLMAEIRSNVPILPVAMVSDALLAGAGSEAEITAHVTALIARLQALGAPYHLRRGRIDLTVSSSLGLLRLRHLVTVSREGRLTATTTGADLLAYYAAAVQDVTMSRAAIPNAETGT